MTDDNALSGKTADFSEDDLSQFLPEGRSLGDLPTELFEEQKAILLTSSVIIDDRFEIVEMLGFGGMGAVYKVKDRLMHDELKALKIILPSLVRSDEAQDRFISEAQIAQSLRHEGIVTVYDIGEDKGKGILFLTMELLDGQNLALYLKERGGRVGFEEACDIVLQTCDALIYAHDKEVVHRDIKPHNIFILEDRRVKLLDFGLAKLMTPGRLTRSSMGLGTAYYMSPEQSMGKEVDARADIFSLGIVFYQMLTGQVPMGRFELPSQLDEDVPSSVDQITEKCLKPNPEDRFGEVSEFSKSLEDIVTKEKSLKDQAGAKGKHDKSEEVPPTVQARRPIFPKVVLAAVILIAIIVSAKLIQESKLEDKVKPEPPPKELLEKLEVEPSKPSPEVTAQARAIELFEKGKEQAESGNYRDALKSYREARSIIADLPGVEEKIKEVENRLAESEREKKRADKIASLLSKAEKQLSGKKYTSPKGNNAFSTVKEIQSLDPSNQETKSLINRMCDDYMSWGDAAFDVSNFTKARSHYEKALQVSPGYSSAETKLAACDRKLKDLAAERALLEEERKRQEDARKQEKKKRWNAPSGMVFVKGGCYEMGCGSWTSDCGKREKPVHEVCVDDFYMDKYEVTQKEFQEVMGYVRSYFKGANHPVDMVVWDHANEYCSKVGKRLPTEAEWEYAARSGGKREKYAGSSSRSSLGEYAWYGGNSGRKTHPVGQKKPNGLGLYDMLGNVWEWCSDWYDGDYYERSPRDNPKGPEPNLLLRFTFSRHVCRGGSWWTWPESLTSSNRLCWSPVDTDHRAKGFRCAKSP